MKPNPVVHFEMPYKDHQRLMDFYTKTFGWKMQKLGSDMQDYVLAGTADMDENMMIKEPGSINGGFFPKKPENPQQFPSVVISVDDLQQSIKDVNAAGGKTLGEPVEIPGIGRFISFTDTEGNMVGMLQAVNK